jgi:hypothetical protein
MVCALKRGTSEGVYYPARAARKVWLAFRTAKPLPGLAADSSISTPRSVLLRSSLSCLHCLIARRLLHPS